MKPTDTTNTTRPTWRSLLIKHGQHFLDWIDSSQRSRTALSVISNQLCQFIIGRIEHNCVEIPEAPVLFWENIPKVRACCADLQTFEQPFAIEAYAYVHFLERYRRTWKTLEHLTSLAVLPLGTNGVRVLDIGAGPAHSSYAIHDFYLALQDWAKAAAVSELQMPLPEIACIEQSASMCSFFHNFSEFTNRPGPFGTLVGNFKGLNLQEMRKFHQRQNESTDYWDPETEQFETCYEPRSAAETANSLYRFRLLLMSNFLTLSSEVEQYKEELLALFSDLRAGGIALILGGTGDSYQDIYEQISLIAKQAGMTEEGWHADDLGKAMQEHDDAVVVKTAQHDVYRALVRMVGEERLRKAGDWPDYWSPAPSSRARSVFGLRAFRSGRWPQSN